jgi:hypothetical protein
MRFSYEFLRDAFTALVTDNLSRDCELFEFRSYLNSVKQDSRFYAIEMLLAIRAVHDLGFLHRYILTSDVLEIFDFGIQLRSPCII